MEVKFYKKASYGTLEIARKEVAVQQDPCKYKVWSITKGTDQEYPAQKDGCSAWVQTSLTEWSCIEPFPEN